MGRCGDIVLDIPGDLVFIVIIQRFLDLLEHGVIIHAQQAVQKPVRQQFAEPVSTRLKKCTGPPC